MNGNQLIILFQKSVAFHLSLYSIANICKQWNSASGMVVCHSAWIGHCSTRILLVVPKDLNICLFRPKIEGF